MLRYLSMNGTWALDAQLILYQVLRPMDPCMGGACPAVALSL